MNHQGSPTARDSMITPSKVLIRNKKIILMQSIVLV